MAKLQVFDPPMCCSTGVCGPSVDPGLARFAADVEWLRSQGIAVERYNLSQEPAAFVGNPTVVAAMRARNDVLPIILVDGRMVSDGKYPSRSELEGYVGLREHADMATATPGRAPPTRCC